jgi:hypothetical protein
MRLQETWYQRKDPAWPDGVFIIIDKQGASQTTVHMPMHKSINQTLADLSWMSDECLEP